MSMENLERKYSKEKSEKIGEKKSLDKFSLWNPDVAVVLSMFFTPFFGALIQKKNWIALGEQEKAKSSNFWMIFTIIFHVVILYFEYLLLPDFMYIGLREYVSAVYILISFAPWIWVAIWYFFNGRLQRWYFVREIEDIYPWRPWGKPISIAISLILAFLVVKYILFFIVKTYPYFAFYFR